MRISDWSSDVCSSDLQRQLGESNVSSLSGIVDGSHGGRHMTKEAAKTTPSASVLIDQRIDELGDWRGETLRRIRALIKAADPDVLEEWKWRGTPVWSHAGIICTGETYKGKVKLTFAKGAALPDPARLFNSSLVGNVRRASDTKQGGKE